MIIVLKMLFPSRFSSFFCVSFSTILYYDYDYFLDFFGSPCNMFVLSFSIFFFLDDVYGKVFETF